MNNLSALLASGMIAAAPSPAPPPDAPYAAHPISPKSYVRGEIFQWAGGSVFAVGAAFFVVGKVQVIRAAGDVPHEVSGRRNSLGGVALMALGASAFIVGTLVRTWSPTSEVQLSMGATPSSVAVEAHGSLP